MNPRLTRLLLVGMIASGGPMLLALDLVARRFIFDAQPEDVREALGALVTRFAWLVVPGPVLGGIAGFLAYPRIHARWMARASPAVSPEVARRDADLTALMISASMPQLPALLGDLSVMLGASLAPVLCSTSLSVLAVLLIATLARPSTPG